jgi:hypothetical protein
MIRFPPESCEPDRRRRRSAIMLRYLRYVLPALALLVVAGLVLPLIIRSRVDADRVRCQMHLHDLGLLGVRHASTPGQPMPTGARDELPPGTFQTLSLPPPERSSWMAYTLNVLNEGPPNPPPGTRPRRPPVGLADAIARFDPATAWNASGNMDLANYRLTTALCPGVPAEPSPGSPSPAHYIASGGLGLDTPTKSIDEAGVAAGAYRYNGPTPDARVIDGLSQTVQILETSRDLGPWLQGGPSTLRGLDVAAVPYFGQGRPFGGGHPGVTFAAMADGSVKPLKESIDPGVFRSHLTIAGGAGEFDFGDQ